MEVYTYDREDRLLAYVTPESRKTEYSYDAIGQLVKQRDTQAATDEAFTASRETLPI